MDKFSVYEFNSILLPGVILVYGVGLLFPELNIVPKTENFDLGSFGLFTILAFTAGHFIQPIGNFLENIWWKFRGGKPTQWRADSKLINQKILEELLIAINQVKTFSFLKDKKLNEISDKDWAGVVKFIYVRLKSDNKTERIDMFNANYGLYRNILASILVLLGISIFKNGFNYLWVDGLLIFMAGLSIYRMNRFGVYYAKELYMCFVNDMKEENK